MKECKKLAAEWMKTREHYIGALSDRERNFILEAYDAAFLKARQLATKKFMDYDEQRVTLWYSREVAIILSGLGEKEV
jgi:hypothetical protein